MPWSLKVSATYSPDLQSLMEEKEGVEAEIEKQAHAIANDLGLIMDKTIKLEWHKARAHLSVLCS